MVDSLIRVVQLTCILIMWFTKVFVSSTLDTISFRFQKQIVMLSVGSHQQPGTSSNKKDVITLE